MHAPPSSQQHLDLPLDLNLTSGRILACRFLLSPKETTTMNTHLFSLPRPQRLLALGAFSMIALAVLAGCSGQAAELRRRAEARESKAALAREFGISRATLYEYLRIDD
mgnify:CR=1 FL=1